MHFVLLAIENPMALLHSRNLEDHKEEETGLPDGLFISPSGLNTGLHLLPLSLKGHGGTVTKMCAIWCREAPGPF